MTPSLGKSESVATSSCKEIRDVLSNECSGRPQSGTYWISAMEWCNCDCQRHTNKTMQVSISMLGVWTITYLYIAKYQIKNIIKVYKSHELLGEIYTLSETAYNFNIYLYIQL